MYDPFAQGLIDDIPDLEGLTSAGTRRALSHAYFALMNLKIKGTGTPGTATADIVFLRRLANTLESRAVFDTDVRPEERRASAFVAAEALSLLASLRNLTEMSPTNLARIEREEVFSRVEAALLYIIAGYDANAGGIIREIALNSSEPSGNSYRQSEFYASEWTLDVLINLCRFHLNPLPPSICPVDFTDDTPGSLVDLQYDVRGRLYARMGEAVRAHMGWLIGEVSGGIGVAREQLAQIADRLAANQHHTNADIHHLARLLLVLLNNTEKRSLVHTVPPPNLEDAATYQDYLRVRSKGRQGGSGRPLLWPSVQKYVEECLPGPKQHAVVSMPTGSGKSFLAELAVSQTLSNGWVLYLVPFNALAHQVRRDLRRDLTMFETEVRAFIGGSEYTTLEGERVDHVPSGTIAVMTPEKCSLSLRLNPEAFSTCRLCIFDECHLIGEKTRGPIAELVLSQLMVLAPHCRFVLMSAVVQNPRALAEWLREATGGESLPVSLKWRPTRSLRCAAAVDRGVARDEKKSAQERLALKTPHFKNEKFESNFALLAGLQGAWQTDEDLDYALARLDAKALLKVHREPTDGDWNWATRSVSWVNESSRRIGEMLAEAGMSTLIFLPANKHYPFSVAKKMTLPDRVRAELPKPSKRVSAFLTLSEYELGTSSEIANLIEQGVSVHTAALVETEKFASEESFRNGTTIVMLATGTLAQGLNLPAVAVVIGGTKIGYTPDEDPKVTKRRELSQLINASGRAGRAGFANQGLVVAVPDSVLYVEGPSEAPQIRKQIHFLSRADAAIEISSPLKRFMDSIVAGLFDTERASSEELVAAAMLVGGGATAPSAQEILRRTYAAYLRRRSGLDEGAEAGAQRLVEVRTRFVTESGAPEWLPVAAQRAGLHFFFALRLLQAWIRVFPDLPPDLLEWDVETWAAAFFDVVRFVTPKQICDTVGLNTLKRFEPDMRRVAMSELLRGGNNPEWTPPEQWTRGWQQIEALTQLWMAGRPIKDIASELSDLDPDSISSQRNHGGAPIPKTLAFVSDVIDKLGMVAGGIVAIIQGILQTNPDFGGSEISQIPIGLSALPLCIRFGCRSPQILAWYRFGLRLRRPALLLAQAFPLDPSIQDDSDYYEAVRVLRKQWLLDLTPVPRALLDEHREVFQAIKVILTDQDM